VASVNAEPTGGDPLVSQAEFDSGSDIAELN